jgi:proline iminopeptidase
VRQLFPDIKPNNSWYLQRGEIHTIYVEECGNSEGIPVIFLHGGPGTGCMPAHRRFFDPEIYRIILFDQRGCGKSTPHCSIEENTTWDLVADIEAIRKELTIDKTVLFGGSWGSALALAYAQTYPENVSALILRGIFLCRSQEIGWFYQDGTNRLYPDYWQDFIAPVEPGKRSDLVNAYHELLTSPNELEKMAAARAWVQWETRCSQLTHNDTHNSDDHSPAALAMASIENHYFVNDSFFKPNQLLGNMHLLADIPGIIVHGRYDAICPLENAWELHEAWPLSELDIIPAAGHSAFEPGNVDALLHATEKISRMLTEGNS